ncbi:MAG TPA: helix-turn-helix domain-containing protein [Candidatus Nanoarchaeia archaeon]|nr:helix-turn-helix domain-containing protein [Candidatus Nanoarchaeia archaeon]
MIVKKDFLKKLKDFGLNTYESKLWTALLSRGVSTAGELSDIANVPRSRSYDVLESLEKKGFIIMKLGKPIKYIAVPPEEIVSRVKKKIEEETVAQLQSLEELKASTILDELKLLHKNGVELIEPSDFTGIIKGRNNLYNHLEASMKQASNNVCIFTTKDGLARKADLFKVVFKKLSEKGVKIQIAVPSDDIAGISASLKGIADVKTIPDVRARYCLVDGKEVTFMLLDDEEVHPTYDSAVWINTPFFAKALQSQFDALWLAADVLQKIVKNK